jgi:hypothetical protein
MIKTIITALIVASAATAFAGTANAGKANAGLTGQVETPYYMQRASQNHDNGDSGGSN